MKRLEIGRGYAKSGAVGHDQITFHLRVSRAKSRALGGGEKLGVPLYPLP